MKRGIVMLIALDVDCTLYDTRACEDAIIKEARRQFGMAKDAATFACSARYYQEKRNDPAVWFNPEYLITDAIAELKRYADEHDDVHYIVVTARNVDKKYYDKLFAGCPLQLEGIYQRDDYAFSKFELCRELSVDALIDDNERLCREYLRSKDRKPAYVLYTGHNKWELVYFEDIIAKVPYKMNSWRELSRVMQKVRKNIC